MTKLLNSAFSNFQVSAHKREELFRNITAILQTPNPKSQMGVFFFLCIISRKRLETVS